MDTSSAATSSTENSRQRSVLLAGGSGLVGRELLHRAGEGVGVVVSRWLAPLIPASDRPIPAAAAAARALVRAVRESTGQRVLLSGEMQEP